MLVYVIDDKASAPVFAKLNATADRGLGLAAGILPF